MWCLYHLFCWKRVYFFLPQVREVNFVSDAIVEALKKRGAGAIARDDCPYIMLLVPMAHKPPLCGQTVHRSPSHWVYLELRFSTFSFLRRYIYFGKER